MGTALIDSISQNMGSMGGGGNNRKYRMANRQRWRRNWN
jgi:hypothetical protein